MVTLIHILYGPAQTTFIIGGLFIVVLFMRVQNPFVVTNCLVCTSDRSLGVRKTAERETDPDVAVMKGLAQAALNNNWEILRLAQVMAGAVATGWFSCYVDVKAFLSAQMEFSQATAESVV